MKFVPGHEAKLLGVCPDTVEASMAANLPSSPQVRKCGYEAIFAAAGHCRRLRGSRRRCHDGLSLGGGPLMPSGSSSLRAVGVAVRLGRQRSGEIGRERSGEISEGEWRAFLEMEVTPRFPAGLTVLAAYGQWRSPSGVMIKEPSRMLVIWYRQEATSEAAIEAIR